MKSSTKQIILIALSIALVVLFLLMPEQPLSVRNESVDLVNPNSEESSSEDDSESSETPLTIEERIDKAIQDVTGNMPMRGILDLRYIADSLEGTTPEQKALTNYALGGFSIQISEFEKAVNRFEKVITFAGLKKYPDTRLKLAACLEQLGRIDEAIDQLELYKSDLSNEDSGNFATVQQEIDRLKKLK